MLQSKIIRAYKAINNLYAQKLPLTISHKLWTLKQKLEPTWEFQIEKEQEIIMSYNPTIDDDGLVSFKSEDDAKNCKIEYENMCKEIADIDVDLGDFKKVPIALDDKVELSIEDIEALEEFVEFVE